MSQLVAPTRKHSNDITSNIQTVRFSVYLKTKMNEIMRETVLVQFSLVGTYQVSLSRGADLHLMAFFLDVLN